MKDKVKVICNNKKLIRRLVDKAHPGTAPNKFYARTRSDQTIITVYFKERNRFYSIPTLNQTIVLRYPHLNPIYPCNLTLNVNS